MLVSRCKLTGEGHISRSDQPQLHVHLETATQSSQAGPSRHRQTTSMMLTLSFAPTPAAPDQRITLDTVDLVRFSQPFARASTDLPLKAVHRGAVVGLRFVDLSPGASTPPAWKRMQVKFPEPADAARFLRAIDPFCPSAPATTKPKPDASSVTPTIPSIRGSSVVPHSPVAHEHVEPPPPLQRTATVLPPTFAQLFPNLAAMRKAKEPEPEKEEPVEQASASRSLVSLTDDELERVVFEVLAEDGFSELVEKVKEIVYRQEG